MLKVCWRRARALKAMPVLTLCQLNSLSFLATTQYDGLLKTPTEESSCRTLFCRTYIPRALWRNTLPIQRRGLVSLTPINCNFWWCEISNCAKNCFLHWLKFSVITNKGYKGRPSMKCAQKADTYPKFELTSSQEYKAYTEPDDMRKRVN